MTILNTATTTWAGHTTGNPGNRAGEQTADIPICCWNLCPTDGSGFKPFNKIAAAPPASKQSRP